MAKVKSEGKKVYWWKCVKCKKDKHCFGRVCVIMTMFKEKYNIPVCSLNGYRISDWKRLRKPPREVMG
jgi:hypothetical protein